MSYSVYKHTFPNGKVYIGITSQKPEKRWKNGCGYLEKKNGQYSQPLMAKAILKYGWENVAHEILFENITYEDAIIKEKELIKKYNSNNTNYGYNLTEGGEGSTGRIVKEETKRKIRDSISGINHPNYGKHLSDETKRKIGDANKNKKHPTGEKHNRYGKHLSKEAKQKLSEINKGKRHTEETKNKLRESSNKLPVRCIETNKIYSSIRCAENKIKIFGISKVCNGKQKTAGGYHWEFVNKESEKINMNDLCLKFSNIVVYDINKRENIKECGGIARIPDINDNIVINNNVFVVTGRTFNFDDNNIYLFVYDENKTN